MVEHSTFNRLTRDRYPPAALLRTWCNGSMWGFQPLSCYIYIMESEKNSVVTEHKQCGVCKEVKPLSDFHKKLSRRQDRCKSCRKKYHRNHYLTNQVKYKVESSIRRKELRELVSVLKSKPCTDCGRSFPPYVMDFDHIDSNKKMNVSQLINWGSLQRILEEISKCELVCSNCHRVRTFSRRT